MPDHTCNQGELLGEIRSDLKQAPLPTGLNCNLNPERIDDND